MQRLQKRIVAVGAAAALAGAGIGAGAVALTEGGSPRATVTPIGPAGTNVAQTALGVPEVARLATPAVVEVDATSGSSSPFPFGGGGGAAEGSGFVYDTAGHVVTNQHVVDGASSVKVKLPDGTVHSATVVGTDISSDLAVLKVDAPASKLTPLALGDSSTLAVGDGVVAIGNPFGLDETVTSGIVSALDREIQAPDGTPIEGAIQTDAAVNHGNSGGPLLDLQGKVVGITAQIKSESGGSDGVAFAIPSNTIRNVVGQLLAGGKVQHALLGIAPADAPGGGVRVLSVEAATGAGHAGIKAGDVLTAVDGMKLADAAQLRALIDAHKPGDRVTVTLRRGGATKTVTVTLGSRS